MLLKYIIPNEFRERVVRKADAGRTDSSSRQTERQIYFPDLVAVN